MRTAQDYLELIHERGRKGLELNRVYRIILNRDLFLAAYGKLYANKGATTPGTDPNDTIEGMSIERIDKVIEKLKNRTFRWKPVKRVHIPKKNGKKRPLGISNWEDKMVEEVLRMVLEAYYEPQFSEHSHGFRPKRGCHTALREIQRTWKGTKWFIEGDIKGCYDNISHKILIDIINRNIKDRSLIKLLEDMLKAGYMEQWKFHQTYSGTPQGNGVSPLLANIVLNELDKYVENELIPKYTRGKYRKKNPEYTKLSREMEKASRNKDIELYQRLRKERRKVTNGDPNDPTYRRLRYIRYADDFVLGWAGTKAEAEQIKEEVRQFLQTIRLELSAEKTLITHASTEKARFLGYDVQTAIENSKQTKGNRSINGRIILTVPPEVTAEWIRKVTRKGKPIHRCELLHNSDFEIISIYGMEFQGLANYYTMAQNVSDALYKIKYYYGQSLAKTLAAKHKKTKSWAYRKYYGISENGVKAFTIEVPNPNNPNKPLKAQFGGKPIRYNPNVVIKDKKFVPYITRNELIRRLTANVCELCGSTENIRVHHARALKDIEKKYKGRKNPPDWIRFMMERRRKTIVVCHECHKKIHEGKYDGKRVE
jgi:group II intron reverse transcriptase/maturase